MESVRLHELLILEVNYHYEGQLTDDTTRPPLCLLLLGLPLNDHEKFEIQRAIPIPLRLQVMNDQDGQFCYDLDKVSKRIKLIRETNNDLQLCGIMVINEKIYDYEKPIENLMQDFQGQIKYLFTYEPGLDVEMDRKLNGFTLLPKRQRIGYRLKHGKVNIEADKIVENDVNPFSHQISTKQHMDQELSFSQKLTQEINKMIQYLDNRQPSDLILRQISMLVSQLEKGPTIDIEETIMKKEGELDVLRTICDQWEMGIELSN